jgi:hypothetical protein
MAGRVLFGREKECRLASVSAGARDSIDKRCGWRSAGIGLADCVQEILIHSVGKPDPSRDGGVQEQQDGSPVLHLRQLARAPAATLGVGWRSE